MSFYQSAPTEKDNNCTRGKEWQLSLYFEDSKILSKSAKPTIFFIIHTGTVASIN